MDYKKICVLDLETTGTTTDDAPIQVAGLLVNENGEVLSSFEEKIKTTHIISPGASAVNGIYKEDLANCRTEIPVLTDFASWIIGMGAEAFLTYNGKRFDIPMLQRRVVLLGIKTDVFSRIPNIDCYYDCVKKAKEKNLFGLKDYLGRGWKLTNVATCLGINTDNAHDAFADARMTSEVYFKLKDKI